MGYAGHHTLKASAGTDPMFPPTTGWQFENFDNFDKFEEDPSLSCTLPDKTSSTTSYKIRVELSQAAAEAQPTCAGDYLPTGMRSAGREASILNIKAFSEYTMDKQKKLFILSRCSNWTTPPLSATS